MSSIGLDVTAMQRAPPSRVTSRSQTEPSDRNVGPREPIVKQFSSAYSRAIGRKPTRSGTDRSAWNSTDIFGSGALRAHRGFEPVCLAGASEGDQGDSADHRALSGWTLKSEEPRALPRVVVMCHRFLNSSFVQAAVVLMTLAVLYCGDLFQCFLDVSYDTVYTGILWAALVLFSIEWVLSIVASPAQKPGYTCSLFFFLDLIATVSIGVEILMLEANNLMNNGVLARAARAARIGTRAGRSVRLLRLVRFLRLTRVARFIGSACERRDGKKRRRPSVPSPDEQLTSSDLMRADAIGSQIAATTIKKVVVMSLMLLLVLPLLERNQNFQTCSAELVSVLESLYDSGGVRGNCSKMREQVQPWFTSVVVPFSKSPDSGLSVNGLIYADVRNCVLYRDTRLMGSAEGEETQLLELRRGTEIQAIPCDAVFEPGAGRSAGSATYLLYDMQEEEKESSKFAMGFTTVVVVTLLVFSLIFSQDAQFLADILVYPIRQLMQDMGHTSRLELDQVTKEEDLIESNVYEVRRLQAAYLNLNGAVGSFAKFTPLEVVRHFLCLGTEAKLGVNQCNVSIFFSDIAGFTSICQGTPPIEVLSLLSEYFESMVSIIVEEQGTMLEFIGDAILAIWNAPNTVPDHAIRSITSALRMNAVLADLRNKWTSQGRPSIRIRCGLHSADVFVGNLGSRMRMKYGVLGDGVNLASRLEELNKRYDTEILISEDCLLQDGVRDTFHVRQVDYVVVKGRLKPTAIFEVLGLQEGATNKVRDIASQSAEAIRHYMSRHFRQALDCLDKVAAIKDGLDPAGAVLAARCRGFLERPPPADWRGAEVLNQKTFGHEE